MKLDIRFLAGLLPLASIAGLWMVGCNASSRPATYGASGSAASNAFVEPAASAVQAHVSLSPTVLGTAGSFAVLGGSTVTNTGPSIVVGNLGVEPGLAVTGFPPGLVSQGTILSGGAVALQGQSDLTTAYDVLAGQTPDLDLTGQDLGNAGLTRGVYRFATSAQLTGTLVLDAEGDPAATFVFQIGTTLTTASGASVQLINGGDVCNVYWQVGSSATLGVGTSFVGNILALTSITLNTGASVSGRALARNGAVTLDTNVVSIQACSEAAPSPTILSLSPTEGPVGTTVTILAQDVGDVAVDFNGTGAPATIAAGPIAGQSIITVSVPEGATSGQVHVYDAGSDTTLDAGVFEVTEEDAEDLPPPPPPAILEICPLRGCVGEDVTILVEGIGAWVEVDFNGTPVSWSVTPGKLPGQSLLHVLVPQGATTGPVHVYDVESRTLLVGDVFTVTVHKHKH